MKTARVTLIIAFIIPMYLSAQYKTLYWSIRRCEISSSLDSAFLVNTEKRMWKASLTGAFPVYEGMFGGKGYRVRMSKAAADISFADSTINKLVFPGGWELATLWNCTADTFEVISFEPNCAFLSRSSNDGKLKYSFETFCFAHVPLFYYHQIIEQKEFDRIHHLTLNSLAKSFNAALDGDTLYRVVHFLNDSNGYFPQAGFRHLATAIQNGTYSGQIKCYRTAELNTAMSKRAIEESFVHWDSTNSIEDPNHRGTFVYAPIKYQLFPKGIVIYERWVPHYNREETPVFPNFGPQAYMTFHREVMAYGTRYGVDWNKFEKILWHNPVHVATWLNSSVFNWSPYEESFRAERFQTMHIALEP